MAKNTLLILGAGASVNYGLPLGRELVRWVRDNITSMRPSPHSPGDDAAYRITLANWQEAVRSARPPSIDLLMHDRGTPKALVAAVAQAIWRHEDLALKRYGMHQADIDDDWIWWMFYNRMNRHPSSFASSNIRILTFNYERLPYGILASLMANAWNDQQPINCLSTVTSGMPRIHIHGELQAQLSPDESRKFIRSHFHSGISPYTICNDLKIMHDTDHINTMRNSVMEYIAWADRVFFLGIGYHHEMRNVFAKGTYQAKDWISEKECVAGTCVNLTPDQIAEICSWGGRELVLDPTRAHCVPLLEKYWPDERTNG